jgi:hypothetical protein
VAKGKNKCQPASTAQCFALIFCEGVKQGQNGTFNLVNVHSDIWAMTFPAQRSMYVYFEVYGWATGDRFELRVNDPGGNRLGSIGPNDFPPAVRHKGFTGGIEIRDVEFLTEGIYYVQLLVNGRAIQSKPLRVTLAPPSAIGFPNPTGPLN